MYTIVDKMSQLSEDEKNTLESIKTLITSGSIPPIGDLVPKVSQMTQILQKHKPDVAKQYKKMLRGAAGGKLGIINALELGLNQLGFKVSGGATKKKKRTPSNGRKKRTPSNGRKKRTPSNGRKKRTPSKGKKKKRTPSKGKKKKRTAKKK